MVDGSSNCSVLLQNLQFLGVNSVLKQVRRYCIRIKKFINTYSGKIIQIYQRYGLLSRDSLGLGVPYSTKKWYCL